MKKILARGMFWATALLFVELLFGALTGQQMFDVARAIAKAGGYQFNSEWARIVPILEDSTEGVVVDMTLTKTQFYAYRDLLNAAKLWIVNFAVWPVGETGKFIYSILLRNKRDYRKGQPK